MGIGSVYDEMLEDTRCPRCGTVGMLPDGGVDWVCPQCGYEGSFEDDKNDENNDLF